MELQNNQSSIDHTRGEDSHTQRHEELHAAPMRLASPNASYDPSKSAKHANQHTKVASRAGSVIRMIKILPPPAAALPHNPTTLLAGPLPTPEDGTGQPARSGGRIRDAEHPAGMRCLHCGQRAPRRWLPRGAAAAAVRAVAALGSRMGARRRHMTFVCCKVL